jgi:hypothetical protein
MFPAQDERAAERDLDDTGCHHHDIGIERLPLGNLRLEIVASERQVTDASEDELRAQGDPSDAAADAAGAGQFWRAFHGHQARLRLFGLRDRAQAVHGGGGLRKLLEPFAVHRGGSRDARGVCVVHGPQRDPQTVSGARSLECPDRGESCIAIDPQRAAIGCFGPHSNRSSPE